MFWILALIRDDSVMRIDERVSKNGKEKHMKKVLLTQRGEPREALHVVETEIPEPTTGQVRVKVLATGVAFADVMMRRGAYFGEPKLPFTPGYDIYGIVDKQGPDASKFHIGQSVVGLTTYYGNAQYVCLDEKSLVPVPQGIDPAEATSLVLNYTTAYQMLHRVAHVKSGEKILIHGAAGGVGTALLQLGKLAGVQMYGTASRGKHPLLEQYGATPIDYKKEDFVKRVLTLPGDGVDAVFDPIGGVHLHQSFKTLRKGGRLVAYGNASAVAQGGNRLTFVIKSLVMAATLQWWSLLPNGKHASLYLERYPKLLQEDLTVLIALLVEGKIKPIIAKRLPLEQIAYANELLETSQVEGKIVLLPNESAV